MVQCQNFGVLSKPMASAKVFFGDKDKQNPKQHPPNKNAVCGGDPREMQIKESSP